MQCPACGGAGQSRTKCSSCSGSGLKKVTKNVEVKVPAGCDSGTNLRLLNMGDAGAHGGPKGHLWVMTRISEHPIFRRDGLDVHVNIPISVATAVLGGSITVPTLKGTPHTVALRPGTQPEEVIRLNGFGVKHITRSNFGDQVIHIKVEIPRYVLTSPFTATDSDSSLWLCVAVIRVIQ